MIATKRRAVCGESSQPSKRAKIVIEQESPPKPVESIATETGTDDHNVRMDACIAGDYIMMSPCMTPVEGQETVMDVELQAEVLTSVKPTAQDQVTLVEIKAVDQLTSVETPALDQVTSVETPALYQLTSVETPALDPLTPVETPTEEQLTLVETPAVEQLTSKPPALDQLTSAMPPAQPTEQLTPAKPPPVELLTLAQLQNPPVDFLTSAPESKSNKHEKYLLQTITPDQRVIEQKYVYKQDLRLAGNLILLSNENEMSFLEIVKCANNTA